MGLRKLLKIQKCIQRYLKNKGEKILRKTEKMSKTQRSKGFNLFTPLVGTSVVIISMLISVAMVQNSVNISEGVSKSYTTSEQVTGSQLIETSSSIQIMENIEKTLSSALEEGVEVTCGEDLDCQNEISEKFNDWNALKSNLLVDIYSGMETRFERMGYSTTMHEPCEGFFDEDPDDPTDPKRCMSMASIRSPEEELFDINYDEEEGRFHITVHTPELEHQEAFHLSFTKDDTTISHRVIPGEVTTTSRSIKEQIEATEKALEELKNQIDQKGIENIEEGEDLEEFCMDIQNFLPEQYNITLTSGTIDGKASVRITWQNPMGRGRKMELYFKEGEPKLPISHQC